ncbi:hypothetical protein D9758_014354 [Tetrapyrgos nigripes]|uniref:Uncharacterized protein n=1 Tax=Tetrapyrgos nigripes TaxID=182062 RepID=A0A8H5C6W1_9AGAR|nr:hypothetical protein D9758_014354 [Tetrapyrgos nigripes]
MIATHRSTSELAPAFSNPRLVPTSGISLATPRPRVKTPRRPNTADTPSPSSFAILRPLPPRSVDDASLFDRSTVASHFHHSRSASPAPSAFRAPRASTDDSSSSRRPLFFSNSPETDLPPLPTLDKRFLANVKAKGRLGFKQLAAVPFRSLRIVVHKREPSEPKEKDRKNKERQDRIFKAYQRAAELWAECEKDNLMVMHKMKENALVAKEDI